MKRKITFYFLLLTFFCAYSLNAQTTTIPDNEFETFLETHDANGNVVPLGDSNSMGDGTINQKVLTNNISGVTQLFIDNYNISDFEGLKSFTSINDFTVSNNQATTIKEIDFSGNVLLTKLFISNTPNLSKINILQNVNLVDLYVVTFGNLFEAIDVSANIELINLSLGENAISSLELAANTNLTTLSVSGNPLTSLAVPHLTKLQTLLVSRTEITSLDVSKNTKLIDFWCHDGKITDVNLKNGFNTNLTSALFYDNPNLSCILVDDATYSETATNWTKDATATYVDTPPPVAGNNTSYPTVCSLPIIEDLFDLLDGANEGGTWSPEQVDGPGDYIYTVTHDCYPSVSATVTVEEGVPPPDAGPEDDLSAIPGLINLNTLRGWSGNKLNLDVQKNNHLKFTLADDGVWASVGNEIPISKDGDVDFPNSGAGAAKLYSFTYTKSNQCSSDVAAIDVYLEGFNIDEHGTTTICENDLVTEQVLFDALTENLFELGGIWTASLGVFGDPDVYTYDDFSSNSAVVTVTEELQLSAGTNSTLKILIDGMVTEAQLFNALQGEDTGGKWSPLPLSGADTYTYTHSATSCYPAQSAVVVVTESVLSVYENEFLNDLVIYPNPTKEMLYLKGDISMLKSIEIYSTKGQRIKKVTKNLDAIDLSMLKSTLYFVKLHTENATKVSKIIKK